MKVVQKPFVVLVFFTFSFNSSANAEHLTVCFIAQHINKADCALRVIEILPQLLQTDGLGFVGSSDRVVECWGLRDRSSGTVVVFDDGSSM